MLCMGLILVPMSHPKLLQRHSTLTMSLQHIMHLVCTFREDTAHAHTLHLLLFLLLCLLQREREHSEGPRNRNAMQPPAILSDCSPGMAREELCLLLNLPPYPALPCIFLILFRFLHNTYACMLKGTKTYIQSSFKHLYKYIIRYKKCICIYGIAPHVG